MKKELIAIITLPLLLAGIIFNTNFLSKKIDAVVDTLKISENSANAGDIETAVLEAEKAASKWKSFDNYMESFVRDNEIDAATDGFYELLSYLYSGDADSAKGAYSSLIVHLQGITEAEKITLSNIF